MVEMVACDSTPFCLGLGGLYLQAVKVSHDLIYITSHWKGPWHLKLLDCSDFRNNWVAVMENEVVFVFMVSTTYAWIEREDRQV